MQTNIKWTSHICSPDGAYDYTVPASVPGCIHTDLLSAGIITEPFWRDNADAVQWIENCDVTYTGTFTLDAVPEKCALLFHGLDCYAAVSVNGVKLGETDNMFIPWRFDVSDVLQTGENVITVAFRSPVREVEGLPKRSGAFTTERMYTRRVQCTYGWDWVGRFVTMGIWRPVELVEEGADALTEDRRAVGNDGIYVWTKNVNPFGAQVGLQLRFLDVTGDAWVHMTIAAPDGKTVWAKKRRILSTVYAGRAEITETADIAEPELWYPVGYGEQPIYTLTCAVYNKEGICTAEKVQPFGIRTVVILETEDVPGSAWAEKAKKLKEYDHLIEWDRNEGSSRFCLLVNGVEIFCQGANWVPCEPFPSGETPEKIERLVHLAKLGGVNMLRVWGGGIFENDAFYTACDKEGILVTQDFLMACGQYPEDDPDFLAHLRKEAMTAGFALRNHPSLVWWSGDNENAVAGDENMERYSGRRAALEAIGPVLSQIDPQRRFLPSSPYGGVPYASGVRGTSHNTQFLGNFFGWVRAADANAENGVTKDEKGWSCYREYFDRYLDRFTAEQPAIGMPFVSSLRKFMTDEDIFGDDTSISEYHTKNNPGLGAITLYGYVDRLAKGIFGDYTSGADRVKKMQWLHCEWIRLSMELFRRNAWYSSGILYWMWNDCWPAANGWSMADYYTQPKPGFYSFRRCAKPVIASVVPDEDGKTVVYLSHNGAGETAKGHLRLYRYNLTTGTEDFETVVSISQPAGVTGAVLAVPAIPMDGETVLLADVMTDRGADRAFSLPPMHRYADMAFGDGELTVLAEDAESITVRADGAVPFAMIDREDVWSGMGEFMKAGETKVFTRMR